MKINNRKMWLGAMGLFWIVTIARVIGKNINHIPAPLSEASFAYIFFVGLAIVFLFISSCVENDK